MTLSSNPATIAPAESPLAIAGKSGDETYIRLALNSRDKSRQKTDVIVALDTETVQEVLVIPSHRLTVMPNMPSPVIGLLNHRSRVIWVVDLAQLLGLPPLNPRSPDYPLAVLQAGGISLGLAISEVKGITRFAPEAVASPVDHDLPAEMVAYLRGCVVQDDAEPPQQPLLILDAEAIAAYSA